MDTLRLDGKWEFCEAPLKTSGESGLRANLEDSSEWITAVVPGEVHLDLMRAGRMEEPLVGLNAKKSRWPERRSWWYRRIFRVSSAFTRHERQQVVLEGIDYYGQVFLNGVYLGETRNAFVPHVFDVRGHLRKGENVLVVRVTAGGETVPPALRPKAGKRGVYGGRQAFPGISRLRKPQFTYGWDWVDALPNIGLWRGVRLEGRSGVVLDNVRTDTRLNGRTAVLDVTCVVDNIHPWRERAVRLDLTIHPPNGNPIDQQVELHAQVGLSSHAFEVTIPNARLWWPNGMGDQPLYRVEVRTSSENTEHDRRTLDVGLRTVEIDRSRIASGGSRFCIKVNGQEVFCKGGNWIPADAIIARVDRRKYEALVDEARLANLNMLRVWGGGVYESPHFYDACDRAGILVWQDFMFSCAQYPDNEEGFRLAVRAEAESVVRELRHHPSIALWSGNNENTWGFADWWNAGKDVDSEGLQLGGQVVYNQILPEVCRSLDPLRPYWPSSPCGGDSPNSEMDGDCHWWFPGTMNPDIERRISHEIYDECRARFVSEYGVIGPCHMESVNEYLAPSDCSPESVAWQEHTNTFEKATLPAAIERHYADLADLSVADRILYGQLFQATMYGRSIEALRFRKHDERDDCQGALIWMYNDCWGETGWTPIDYYLRRKPSYYWIRNACAPVRALVRKRGEHLVVRTVNDTLAAVAAELIYGWMRIDGTDARTRTKRVSLKANSMLEVAREPIPQPERLARNEWIYAAYLRGDGIEMIPATWMLAPYRQLSTQKPSLQVTADKGTIRVVSDVFCHAVHVADKGQRAYSDNYFDLLPGVEKVIRRTSGNETAKPRFVVLPTKE